MSIKIPVQYDPEEYYFIACRCLINDIDNQLDEIFDAMAQLIMEKSYERKNQKPYVEINSKMLRKVRYTFKIKQPSFFRGIHYYPEA